MLSHPIDVSHGNTKATLDYFTEEAIGISLRSHLKSQLMRLKELSEPERDVIFSVNLKKELELAVFEIFREFKLEKCLLRQEGMYVYEKNIF